ncbi:MAG: four helix bundle protein [Chitinophagales bacterium]
MTMELSDEDKRKRKFDLEERLIDFSVLIIQIADHLKDTRAGNHIAGQVVRSGTHPALHYGEAQSAESRQDFIHKLKVLLKELRETNNALKIIRKASLSTQPPLIERALPEINELISIFVKSIVTAETNLKTELSKRKTKMNPTNNEQPPKYS